MKDMKTIQRHIDILEQDLSELTRGDSSVSMLSEIGEIYGNIALVEIGPYDHIKINDRVLVKMNNDRLGMNPVFRRYFAGVNENGKPTTFARGDLWSSINRMCPLDKVLLEEWDHAELWMV